VLISVITKYNRKRCVFQRYWSIWDSASTRNFTVFFKSPMQMPEQYLTKMFRLGTGLISDTQRASAEVNSKKLTKL
jgi:hypothetical protein